MLLLHFYHLLDMYSHEAEAFHLLA